jgi:hypothetical protein
VFPVGIGLRDPRSQKRDLGHPSISAFDIAEGTSFGYFGLANQKLPRVTLPGDPRDWFISSQTWAYRDAGRDHFVEPDLVFVVLHVEGDWLGWNQRVIGVVAGRDREVLVLAVPLLSTG